MKFSVSGAETATIPRLFSETAGEYKRALFRQRIALKENEMGLLSGFFQTEEQKRQKAIYFDQYDQAQLLTGIIPTSLGRLGIANVMTDKKRKVVLNRVKIIPPVVVTDDYYMVQINTRRLPHKVTITQLMEDSVLQTLSGALTSTVEAQFHPNYGLWYLLPRRGGLGIIPSKISYADVIDLMPKSAKPWEFPIGVGPNKKLTRIDIRHKEHILILGSTGAGKTVFIKNMIGTLCNNISPSRLRLLVCDFKRGPDFKSMRHLPHLGAPSPVKFDKELVIEDDPGELTTQRTGDNMNRILYSMQDILDVLHWASKEVDRRNDKFDDDITDVNMWNAKHRFSPMPHILIIVDELAIIIDELSAQKASALHKALGRVARLGRSAGVHLVLGIQNLESKYLAGGIQNNITTRIVGRMASGPQSGQALGNGSWAATQIPAIKGRVVWRDNMDIDELQTPWVAPKTFSSLVTEITEKWEHKDDGEAETLFLWALEENHGYCGIDALFNNFRGQMGRDTIEFIMQFYQLDAAKMEPVITLNEQPYYLLPSTPQKPRRLVSHIKYIEMTAPPEPETPPEPEPPKHTVTPDDLFKYALTELSGDFSIRKLYTAFSGQGITKAEIINIGKAYEGQQITVTDSVYKLQPGAGSQSRKLAFCVLCSESDSQKTEKTGQGGVLEILEPTEDMDTAEFAEIEKQLEKEPDEAKPDWLKDGTTIEEAKTDPESFDWIPEKEGFDLTEAEEETEETPDWLQ